MHLASFSSLIYLSFSLQFEWIPMSHERVHSEWYHPIVHGLVFHVSRRQEVELLGFATKYLLTSTTT